MRYFNLQLMYHLGFTRNDLMEMSDAEWAANIAVLENIRKQEAGQQGPLPPSRRR